MDVLNTVRKAKPVLIIYVSIISLETTGNEITTGVHSLNLVTKFNANGLVLLAESFYNVNKVNINRTDSSRQRQHRAEFQ